MPEIASRKHIEKINYVIKALAEAGMGLKDMDAIRRDLWSGTGRCAVSRSGRGESDQLRIWRTVSRSPSYRRSYFCQLHRK